MGSAWNLNMNNELWNWKTDKYVAGVRIINDLYNYKIYKVGEWPIKPVKVGDESTLPLAKKAVFKYIEDQSEFRESKEVVMSKAKEFINEVSDKDRTDMVDVTIESIGNLSKILKEALMRYNKDKDEESLKVIKDAIITLNKRLKDLK